MLTSYLYYYILHYFYFFFNSFYIIVKKNIVFEAKDCYNIDIMVMEE